MSSNIWAQHFMQPRQKLNRFYLPLVLHNHSKKMNKAHNTLSMLGLVAVLALSACTDRTERSLKSSSPVAPPPSMAAPATTGGDSQAAMQQMPASGGEVALNPEHGQPGHRCEIPVGAPLNSTPASGSPSVTINPSASSPAAPAPATTARLNPAHGEPGHDCAIPVGSPLPN